MKDKVKIKWDKNKEFVEFICGRQKEVVNIRPEWSEEVFLCTVLFYKNDSVKIISWGIFFETMNKEIKRFFNL